MRTIFEIIAVLVLGAVLYEIARMLGLLSKSLKMTRSIRPFERHDRAARHRILLIGDSTGYGTGTSDARHTISGRIAGDFPNAHVENWSETGSKLGYVARKLNQRPASNPPFDLVILMAGGMDIVHLASMRKIRRKIGEAIAAARRHGRMVLVVGPHNAGRVPMFRPPLSWRNDKRATAANRVFAEACAAHGVPLVSLHDTNAALAEGHLYSRDKTHPTDEGYGLWYEKIRPAIRAALIEKIPVAQPHSPIAKTPPPAERAS